jgi:hypothetical protein
MNKKLGFKKLAQGLSLRRVVVIAKEQQHAKLICDFIKND